MFIRLRSCALCLLIAMVAGAPALADFKEMLGRIPGEANILVVCDVDRIMKSPLAVKQGLAAKRANAYESQPMVVPPEATRVVMAGLLNLSEFETVWEVSVIELAKARSIESIAKGERGFVDLVADKKAAYSPLDAYFLELGPQTLGVVAPANRQFAARWARQKQTLGGAFVSWYLRQAAAAVDTGTEFVLAIDFEDVVSAPRVGRRIRTEPWPSLEGKKYDLKTLCELLASAKGLTLKVEFSETITGKGTLDFGLDTAPLAELGKPLLLDVLSRCGAHVADLENWKMTASGKKLTLEGPLSLEGFQQIASIIQPPAPQQEVATPVASPGETPPKPQEGEAAPKSPAEASVEYYRTIDRIIEKLAKDIGSGIKSAALSKSAAWMRRDARRITRLPILNVDPELVAWGGEVAARLSETATVFAVGGQSTVSGTQSIRVEGTYGYDDGYGAYDDWHDDQADIDRINRDKQARAVVAERKAQAIGEAGQILQSLVQSKAQIRAAMTAKYNVEF